ncbi:hypothetical protein B0T26DRAFT_829964 [Lasiosphaeria miniovina]|uniref:Uncharacterized protein n=1 Tax=Lasiosphaeria miniovina TaxID=1954250 RepID=A0AA40DVI9_9PEZI|nr:uncharacterized protein B0T26DRAFT_829964 [Lasiosphaeria miniovina]KAK0717919.1 hypothetical protein B0T26DRAFT_829964 [Lasiosphaeria miniovina]
MGSPNPWLSNGTCYYAAGKQADNSFIPCGNDAIGHKSCCTAGDVCLSQNACYDAAFGLTYLAGCSDPEYKDDICPSKNSYTDSPWVGLVYCTPNRWMACAEKGKPSKIRFPDSCTCPPTVTAAFTAAGKLFDMARLPGSLGGSIEWSSDYLPPTSSTSSSTQSTSLGDSSDVPSSSPTAQATPTTAPMATPTAAPTTTLTAALTASLTATSTATLSSTSTLANPTISVNSNADSGLGAGAKVGIGVGATIGGLLFLGALSALWMLYRRKRKDLPEEQWTGPVGDPKSGSMGPGEMPMPTLPVLPPEMRSDQTARPPSELHGNNAATYMSRNSPGYPPTNSPGYPPTNSPGYPQPNSPGYPPTNSPGYHLPNSPGYTSANSPGYPPTVPEELWHDQRATERGRHYVPPYASNSPYADHARELPS